MVNEFQVSLLDQKLFLQGGPESISVYLSIPTSSTNFAMQETAVLAVGVAVPDCFPEDKCIAVALDSNNVNASQSADDNEVVQEIWKLFGCWQK